MLLPHFEMNNCFVTPWKSSKEILHFMNSREITHCAYAIAIGKNEIPSSDVLPYQNEKTIYIGSTGGEIVADRKSIKKNRYKVYTVPHKRMKEHIYGFNNPQMIDESKYGITLEFYKIDDVHRDIYFSLIIPRKECSEIRKRSLVRKLEYEHIDAFIETQDCYPFMNREFFDDNKKDESSLSSIYIKEYKKSANLMEFIS